VLVVAAVDVEASVGHDVRFSIRDADVGRENRISICHDGLSVSRQGYYAWKKRGPS
jgi:hypothetical protein